MATSGHRTDERGQVIVVFALALVALVAMAGLIIDGGGAYAQSRDEQKAADLAALAGANDYLLNSQSASALATAATIATANGYTDGTVASSCPTSSGRTTVSASLDASTGKVTVTITAPHSNGFARVIPGNQCWPVTTTATAQAGIPDTATGVAPFMFNVNDFGTDGSPLSQYADPSKPFTFHHGTSQAGDAPAGPNNMAWTDWSFTANLNTAIVSDIIDGSTVINETLTFGEYIGQHNNGQHAALFGDVNNAPPAGLLGLNLPVPVVDGNGNFQGWATFHITSADQGGKSITGYFVSNYLNAQLSVGTCTNGHCPRYLGSWSLRLTN
ncbi:MAG: TadE/TadG family type IV pilus assembly protein [Candidatus Limnocylindrales bacterium]